MKNITEILKLLGAKKNVFFQAPRIKKGEYVVLTTEGQKAYDKLMYLLYGLENLGVLKNVNDAIDKLDEIILNSIKEG